MQTVRNRRSSVWSLCVDQPSFSLNRISEIGPFYFLIFGDDFQGTSGNTAQLLLHCNTPHLLSCLLLLCLLSMRRVLLEMQCAPSAKHTWPVHWLLKSFSSFLQKLDQLVMAPFYTSSCLESFLKPWRRHLNDVIHGVGVFFYSIKL